MYSMKNDIQLQNIASKTVNHHPKRSDKCRILKAIRNFIRPYNKNEQSSCSHNVVSTELNIGLMLCLGGIGSISLGEGRRDESKHLPELNYIRVHSA